MSQVKAPLKIRLKVAIQAAVSFLKRPKTLLLSVAMAIFGFTLINALFDYELLWTLAVLDAPLNFRLEAMRDVLFNPSGLPLPNIFAIVIMSFLFGYVIAASIYIGIRKRKKSSKSGGLGLIFGIISGGCAACGTSILAPLLTTIGITTTSAALSFALVLNVIGILILLYSAYKVSIVLSTANRS